MKKISSSGELKTHKREIKFLERERMQPPYSVYYSMSINCLLKWQLMYIGHLAIFKRMKVFLNMITTKVFKDFEIYDICPQNAFIEFHKR